ncbi:hypothetical protein LAD12857_29100 [Lacrimispora amygdalina]|uniref:Uncharacterized protein n=1 Tax=Lacrimispora amygdalina TaxID=253257 RepID=A0ABQ5M8B3_9FIRM
MGKTKIMYSNKKCQCCGKLYPPKTDQKRCTCERAGLLVETGTWHQPKMGGGAGGI